MSERIDMTPTWSEVLPGLIAAANNGNSKAFDELMRMAAAVDQANANARGDQG